MKNGIKTIKLENGEYLHFWYANNKGRGTDNCTIIRSTSTERATMSRKQTGVVIMVRTSAFHGKINFSRRVWAELGYPVVK